MRAAPGDVVPPRTEAGLDDALRRASRGDEAGFVALYRDLQPRLLRYATALVGAEAEDVTAETWLQVARDLHGFQGDLDGFRGWVSTICRNRAMDWARTRTRHSAEPNAMDVLAEHPDTADAHGSAVEGMSTRWAMAQILALPQTEAEAVLLRAVIGLDATSAGKVLGKRPGAVRVAAHRGLKRLARVIRDDDWTGEGHV
ncbi:RNA polymerase sigma factor [Pseudonocardia sp. DSM 110487]|uniref:RNA polymerase sigma factor n=1 Tax=Pseudonocardia sp. DSM 110487 TaxID=2865833 RepID=UPI001C699680|nr:RNA polymerase sigma factor [Pseudonocardia sp. DSM 110487]QYN34170.1 RNA polymerase sigma factor [Pseudonocardia sp. DSM 110487]